MGRLSIATALLAVCTSLFAQAPAPKNMATVLGFSYDLPSDWTVVEAKPSSQEVKTAPEQAPVTEEQKKGTACIQVALTAMHGTPSSVVVVVALPFDCYGQTMSDQDLKGFGSGAADGLKQTFDLVQPVYGVYSLGSHHLWIERAKGSPKGKPETQYTMEITCSMLRKGAACWMTLAADEASLHAFESGRVTLDGEAATQLVPASAFNQAPS
ncbi:MAG TPA: hypothetical protein VL991_10525 [Terracidiphilus sp.]|nr:hypothetical protein [Terracidiphilus sp.]